jgi:phosphatidylglycerophosphate synthase
MRRMLDRAALTALKPALQLVARRLVAWSITADTLTLLGFAIGMLAALCIALQAHLLALALILLSRLLDGLDGAVARLTQPTDRGAFFDIALDFLFYASIPLAFAWSAPAANALAAATLLAAFMGTGSSFLAFAAVAEKRGMTSQDYPDKGLYYLGGLTEGTETLLCFVLMCLWPQHFAGLAYGFAALCALTIATRLIKGWQQLRP